MLNDAPRKLPCRICGTLPDELLEGRIDIYLCSSDCSEIQTIREERSKNKSRLVFNAYLEEIPERRPNKKSALERALGHGCNGLDYVPTNLNPNPCRKWKVTMDEIFDEN